jgi:1-acyl-sn-glycerol-3-phosphate acyltransferase
MRSAFYVFIRTLLYIPAKLIFRVRVRGRENEPRRIEGPYLVCANHQTVLDVVFLALALRHQQPHFMAKEGVFRVPVLRRLVKWLGAFPVARGRADVGAVKHSINLLKSGRTVGIFPQGTRCAGKDLRDCRVKAGAGLITSHTGAQVLPVYIDMKEHKWKFFRRVTVVIGEPIPFESFGYDKERPGEYVRMTNEIYERICALEDTLKCPKQ